MSDETTDTPEETPVVSRPVGRLGRSLNVALQVILFTVAVLALNYLSCAKHKRIDLSARKDFTLSQASRKVLESDALQKREQPVKIIAMMRRGSPHYSRIKNLLDEYRNIGNGAIELEIVDPIRQTDRALEIESTYLIPYTEDLLIVDGRVPKSEDAKEDADAEMDEDLPLDQTPTTAAQERSAHVRTLPVKQLYLQDIDQFKNLYISAWQDEDVVTSAIRGAVEGKPRKFYFAADKSNLEANDGNPPWKIFADLLWRQNIHLQAIRLSDIDKIPADAEGFALIAPQHDLNERESKIIGEYWDRPKAALVITLDPSAKLNVLRMFLRNYGITPRNDRVVTMLDGQRLSNARAIFTRGPEVTRDLGGNATIFDGNSSSLEVRENDDKLLNRRIIPMAFVQAADGWWGETRFNDEVAEFNKDEDYAGPLYLAAGVIRGQANSDDTATLVSKMMVISNSGFLSSDDMRSEQADFVQAGVNWLVGREELIGIGSKKVHRHKITLLDSHSSYISKIVLFFLPATALLLSMIIWNTRRA